jgi:hypothetical protein
VEHSHLRVHTFQVRIDALEPGIDVFEPAIDLIESIVDVGAKRREFLWQLLERDHCFLECADAFARIRPTTIASSQGASNDVEFFRIAASGGCAEIATRAATGAFDRRARRATVVSRRGFFGTGCYFLYSTIR